MNLSTPSPRSRNGYSPDISATLFLHGEQFNVAAMGPESIILRHPRLMPAGRGILRLQIDHKIINYSFEFPQGIDPSKDRQPYVQFAEATEEVAA